MNIIRDKNSKKRGFTLIELVLVMGIIVLFAALLFGTLLIINTSHARVAIINDAKEFAALNMEAIRNVTVNSDAIVLSNTIPLQAGESGYSCVYFDASGVLFRVLPGNAPQEAFNYDQYTINNGVNVKWKVAPTYTISASGTLDVELEIIDNSTNSTYYSLTSSFYLPNIRSLADMVDKASGAATVLKYRNPSYISVA